MPIWARWVVAGALVALAGCGEGGEGGEEAASASGGSELTAEELEKGIGPIRSVDLGPLDEALADEGEAIFRTKCSACHKLDERYVGPPLGDVLERRTPEYAMNMMVNPAEMVQRHPAARELLATYLTPMPNQNVTEADARALLEYLREVGATTATQ